MTGLVGCRFWSGVTWKGHFSLFPAWALTYLLERKKRWSSLVLWAEEGPGRGCRLPLRLTHPPHSRAGEALGNWLAAGADILGNAAPEGEEHVERLHLKVKSL